MNPLHDPSLASRRRPHISKLEGLLRTSRSRHLVLITRNRYPQLRLSTQREPSTVPGQGTRKREWRLVYMVISG